MVETIWLQTIKHMKGRNHIDLLDDNFDVPISVYTLDSARCIGSYDKPGMYFIGGGAYDLVLDVPELTEGAIREGLEEFPTSANVEYRLRDLYFTSPVEMFRRMGVDIPDSSLRRTLEL